jgi:hypothetical protein
VSSVEKEPVRVPNNGRRWLSGHYTRSERHKNAKDRTLRTHRTGR